MWWWAWWPGPGLLTPPAWPPSACTGGPPGGARPGGAPWWQSSRSVAGAAAGDQWGSGAGRAAETWQQHSYLPRWAISPLYIYSIYFVSLLYLFCTSTVSSSHIYFVYLPYLPHLLCISTVTLYISIIYRINVYLPQAGRYRILAEDVWGRASQPSPSFKLVFWYWMGWTHCDCQYKVINFGLNKKLCAVFGKYGL